MLKRVAVKSGAKHKKAFALKLPAAHKLAAAHDVVAEEDMAAAQGAAAIIEVAAVGETSTAGKAHGKDWEGENGSDVVREVDFGHY